MLVWLREVLRDLLFDESAAARRLAAALYVIGATWKSGGVPPGLPETRIAYFAGEPFLTLGPLLIVAAFYVSAGASTPWKRAKKRKR